MFLKQGNKTNGANTDIVAIKATHSPFGIKNLLHEKNIYEAIKEHESLPKIYDFLLETINNYDAFLVIELLGKSLSDFLDHAEIFSVVTTMRIGLQMVSQ